MVFQTTPYSSKRLFVYNNEFPESLEEKDTLITILNLLSIWGGVDKQGDDYLSWEFDELKFPNSSLLEQVVTRCSGQIDYAQLNESLRK